MKQGFTHITFVLDRSGSMNVVREDVIGGFNKFVEQQKAGPGECQMSLIQFDDQYEQVYLNKPIKDVQNLDNTTFVPRGWTALLDAIGRTIDANGAYFSTLPEDERPESVVFAIFTDGLENRSTEYRAPNPNPGSRIAEMIKHQTDAYQWHFIFLGANQDAIATAAQMNIPTANAMTYNPSHKGVGNVYAAASAGILRARSAGPCGQSAAMGFTPEEREKAKA